MRNLRANFQVLWTITLRIKYGKKKTDKIPGESAYGMLQKLKY